MCRPVTLITWLLIIGTEFPTNAALAQADVDEPAFGFYLEAAQELVPLPLCSTQVRGELSGLVSRVSVTQVYINPYRDVIEASYVFPLSDRAAVTSMVVHLADRDVVAEIHPKQEAERIYEQAVSAGYTAALMTQQRPNIFTQKVGNIPPGERIEVELTYVELTQFEAGIGRFVFPTVVGPRYVPGVPLGGESQVTSGRIADTDRVTDASVITPPVLGPNQSSAHRIDLQLTLAPGLPIADLRSPSHKLVVQRHASDSVSVRLAPMDRIPNKDFVLLFDLRSHRPETVVLAHKQNGQAGYLSLVIQPPALPPPDQIASKDLFFVVDNSGSMSGKPIQACKKLVRIALADMNPEDRFTIMRFSDHVSALSDTPLDNTPDNVQAGLLFIDQMSGMGGTEMLSGVRRALEGASDPGRVRIVFFLTDGYIGNDEEILRAVREDNQAQARLFSLGVGSSVDRYLLNNMARLGRGSVQYIRYDQDPTPIVSTFYRRIRNPVLTDIRIDWHRLQVEQLTPQVVADLFDQQPLVIHARYREAGQGKVTLSGTLGRRPWSHSVQVSLPELVERPAIAAIWARAKIAELMDEENRHPGSKKEEITQLAVEHSLMSKYTAFVAVDRQRVVRSQHQALIPVAQRLPLPDGVSRKALGSLSRTHIPPGDPVLSVAAPSTARRVTAYFPFGLIKPLRWDAIRELWRGRFLVPAGIPDGRYTVLVVVEMADGTNFSFSQVFMLDSFAQEFDVQLDSDVLHAGQRVKIAIDAIEPASEVYVDCPMLGWERIVLESDDDAQTSFSGFLEVPADAEATRYQLLLVVRDLAGNRFEQSLTIFVQPGATPCDDC